MQHLIHDLVSLKVVFAAAEMDESSGCEHSLFIEDQSNSPRPSLDGVVAVTALRHSARRSLGSIDSWEATLRQAVVCDPFQPLSIGDSLGGSTQCLQERLRPLIGGAQGVEPKRHLPFGKGIGQALSESQSSARDGLGAAAAFRSTAGRGLNNVRHGNKNS